MTVPSNDFIAKHLDATLLKPEATEEDIAKLCADSAAKNVYAVCVSPTYVALASKFLKDTGIHVASVVGFPSGAHDVSVKVLETKKAVNDGADEIDMVINIPLVLAGKWDSVEHEIHEVKKAAKNKIVKVILETALLSSDQIRQACKTAVDAGADFVKTSTGMHAAGGATVEDVRLMVATVDEYSNGKVFVKASGGVRTTTDALKYIAAGARRLGTSNAAAILDNTFPDEAVEAPEGY